MDRDIRLEPGHRDRPVPSCHADREGKREFDGLPFGFRAQFCLGPSTAELRQQYGVSITVVRNAMNWMKALGLVEGLPGVGVFVVER
ncbi:GntR family transcriptional regulator [Catellatospora sp. KI3]|uniref:GntR family transcriptional regulator n=1 Tax=Catellatospora sp. KI3 TaxID=3041620 RepID=UPI0032B150B7